MSNALIVGGGPAGSEAARVAAGKGLSVLLIEREEEGARSVCAGGVGKWWLDELGLELPEDVTRRDINSVVIHSPNEDFAIGSEDVPNFEGPLGYVVDRSAFDIWLQERAEEAGAEVQHGVAFKSFTSHDSSTTVRTEQGDEKTENLVLATGARPRPDNHVCYQEVIEVERGTEIELFFLPDFLPEGYLWLFQEGDSRYRLGAGTTARTGISPKRKIREFKRAKGFDGKIYRKEGGLVGTGNILQSPGHNCFYVGDRANLASSLTGAGVYPAVMSGRIAGECIVSGNDYEKRLNEALGDWIGTQKKGRKVTDRMSGEDFDKLLGVMNGFEIRSPRPSEALPSLIKHVFMREPRFIFKILEAYILE